MTRPLDFDRLIEPSDQSDKSRVIQTKNRLLECGFSDLFASAIADFALLEDVMSFDAKAGSFIKGGDAPLALESKAPAIFAEYQHFHEPDSTNTESEDFRQRAIQSHIAFVWRMHNRETWSRCFRDMRFACIDDVFSGVNVVRALLKQPGDLDWVFREVMDWERLPDLTETPELPSGHELSACIESVHSVQDAMFWAMLCEAKFFVVKGWEQFRRLPDERVHSTVRFLYWAFIQRQAGTRFLSSPTFFDTGDEVPECKEEEVDTGVFKAYFEEVTSRLDASGNSDMGLSLAWIMLFRIIHGRELPASLDDRDRHRLLVASRAHMAKLRGIIRRHDADKADDLDGLINDGFDTERGKAIAPVTLLFASGNLWEATKALLQLIRVSPRPVVGKALEFNDGRCLSEITIDPWHLIGLELFRGLQSGFRNEQKRDPELTEFRTSLCRYCLDRLRSKGRDGERGVVAADGLMETDPLWRYGYLRAAQELHINPENRGHRVLHWLMQNDPEERVREAAQIAYKRLSNHVALPQGMSPRRAVLASLWWIRQVHRLSLGLEVDARAAQRTRDREVRMTQRPKD
jgi:hypothetical protein